MYLPDEIRKIIENKPYTVDDIGQSGSKVLIFDDMVLKIQPVSTEVDNEVQLMQWLKDKISAPECLCHIKENDTDYLLMTKIKGKMACDDEYMSNPQKLIDILAHAMKSLWKVDISECPVDMTLNTKLKMAEYNVKNNLVDTENTQPGTFGKDGFESPKHLLKWIVENRPEEDVVLSHGDFCLPNIFIDNDKLAGFIDIGRMGIADRWNDIAICWRSLKDNYIGKYSTKKYDNFDPDYLFEALGIEKDEEKLRYYILMDELF
ncbi:MAG: aminoglycoside 3'-phosphotransferase [Clostridia bacterium]|nr:aminoglycoside 3'-phosphotransferase [Clostridia bacterium]